MGSFPCLPCKKRSEPIKRGGLGSFSWRAKQITKEALLISSIWNRKTCVLYDWSIILPGLCLEKVLGDEE